MNYLGADPVKLTRQETADIITSAGSTATSAVATIVAIDAQIDSWEKILDASNDEVTRAKARLSIANLRLQRAEALQASSGSRMALYTIGIGLGILTLVSVAIFGGKKK